MRIGRGSNNPTIRRLLELGCTADQVRCHIARGKVPPTTQPRPRLNAWWSWPHRAVELAQTKTKLAQLASELSGKNM
jgi:hypothetical protein